VRKRLCDLGRKPLAWSIHHPSAVLRNEPHMLYRIAQMRMGEQNRG